MFALRQNVHLWNRFNPHLPQPLLNTESGKTGELAQRLIVPCCKLPPSRTREGLFRETSARVLAVWDFKGCCSKSRISLSDEWCFIRAENAFSPLLLFPAAEISFGCSHLKDVCNVFVMHVGPALAARDIPTIQLFLPLVLVRKSPEKEHQHQSQSCTPPVKDPQSVNQPFTSVFFHLTPLFIVYFLINRAGSF